jgi:Na+/H+-translocating membrane pyrophosphatase
MLDPIIITTVLIGAGIPYFFSSLTMKAVTRSVKELVLNYNLVWNI